MRPGQDVLDRRAALAPAWLLGDGIGGFSSGAAGLVRPAGAALLAVSSAGEPPRPLLIALDARARHPDRAVLGEDFTQDPWPCWTLACGDTRFRRTLFAIAGHHAIAISYTWLAGPELTLSIGPIVPRGTPSRRGARETPALDAAPGCVRVGDPESGLVLWHDGAFLPAWIERPSEAGGEDVGAIQAGHIEGVLGTGKALHVIAGRGAGLLRALAREDRLGTPPPRTLGACVERLERDAGARRDEERRIAREGTTITLAQARAAHRGDVAEAADLTGPAFDGARATALRLWEALAAMRLAVSGRPTLARGWPDAREDTVATLRALRGWIALRRFEEARAILEGLVGYLDDGLLPSSFDPATGAPRYESAAPSLWLAAIGELYARRSEDAVFASRTLLPAVDSVMQYYRAGTRLGIGVGTDGLLAGGDLERIPGNALWYHAQVAAAQLARAAGQRESAAFHLAWAVRHQQRFVEAFWNERRGRLFDAEAPQNGEDSGESQVQALGAPPLLDPVRARKAIAAVERRRFTPFGLRVRPGDRIVRTAWLPAFHAAYLRAHQRSLEANAQVREWLDTLIAALAPGPALFLPEAFALDEDGAARPHGEARCTVATAELLRLWVEEIEHAAS